MIANPARRHLPSVDRVLRLPDLAPLIERHGRVLVLEAVRSVLAELRAETADAGEAELVARCVSYLEATARPHQRRVHNLTGTVLHTNLGRAVLPRDAIEAAVVAMSGPTTLEYDVAAGRRGARGDHVAQWLTRLTGAQAATVINNNAGAVLLVLNTLALGREVLVSRGELIEIGGSFRMPDIMGCAGCRLREVGTTNRTHLRDFADAIGPETALILKIHTSNYEVRGFTATAPRNALAALARERGIPLVEDLGSGTLVDLEEFGLPHEPTAREALAGGADLVTFSGDKLLGGPQAGLVIGKADLVAALARNPMTRALRLDKIRLAALEAVLRLYAAPDRLRLRLPTLRFLARSVEEIASAAARLAPLVAARLGRVADVSVVECRSQIGSGALPLELLPSRALAIRPTAARGGAALDSLAVAFRALPTPVVGRISANTLLLDVRCLDDEADFAAQLARLEV